MRSLAIVALCVVSAVLYGILHDQITARVCVEYFTIAHPPVFPTRDPTLLAFGWGVIATWWVGLMLGIPLAIAARAGSRPKRSVRSLVRPIVALLAVMAVSAMVAGAIGFVLAILDVIVLRGWLAEAIPADRHARFLFDAWAHSVSYGVGFVGGIVVIARVWRSRRPGNESPPA